MSKDSGKRSGGTGRGGQARGKVCQKRGFERGRVGDGAGGECLPEGLEMMELNVAAIKLVDGGRKSMAADLLESLPHFGK